ncbi:MAG: hypothetical protein IJU93_01675, partial [Lachnospiraceae bacterium]|nr:hypothetical protein [Lachnospiraceae bacterium]
MRNMRKLCKLMVLVLTLTTVLSGCTSQMNLPESNDPRPVSENAAAAESGNSVSAEALASENAEEKTNYVVTVPLSG